MQATRKPAWQVVHARAAGTSHLSSGLPCQDAVVWRGLSSGLLAVALADGAGSAAMSETGAELAVTAALQALEDSAANQNPDELTAWGEAVQAALRSARERLLVEAESTGSPPNSYATTLTCLVAAGNWLVLGQVGDGVLVVRTPQGDHYTLTQAQRGEYANETLFLTMPEALEKAYVQAVELDLAGLALMSDGLLRLAVQLPDYTPHTPFFLPLWAFAARSGPSTHANEQLGEFLKSERVCSRTDDDKSLLLAVNSSYTAFAPETSLEQPGVQAED